MDFTTAFDRVLGHEGGYVNDRRDPGGETKYGISKRAYPMEDIAGLTIERARQIYLRDYWGPAGCDAVPDAVKLPLFDLAVNSGVKTAIRLLQRAVGVTVDGVLGPQTLQAAAAMPAPRLVARLMAHRLHMLTDLAGWNEFGRGWARRIATNLLEA